MRFRKVYVEISNICNLSCRFCPGTGRAKKAMTEEEFSVLLPKLRPYTDFLYFHLMGEPLLHPNLERFLALAGAQGFKVILTTNGTLLKKQQEMLLAAPALHKINISLHAFEANDLSVPFESYLADCFAFGRASAGKKLVVYRLWNQGGEDSQNEAILQTMRAFFPVIGCGNGWAQESLSAPIWSTVTASTGPILQPGRKQVRYSATACGISWAFSATAPLSPAAWITRGILPLETC